MKKKPFLIGCGVSRTQCAQSFGHQSVDDLVVEQEQEQEQIVSSLMLLRSRRFIGACVFPLALSFHEQNAQLNSFCDGKAHTAHSTSPSVKNTPLINIGGESSSQRNHWQWDDGSPLVKDQVVQLSGPNKCTATKIDDDENDQNCMVVGDIMREGTGKHFISFKRGRYYSIVFLGVVKDGVRHNRDYANQESDSGCFMHAHNGSLWGGGKEDSEPAGAICDTDVLTLELDTDTRALRFWLNGKPHGPGYSKLPTEGPLRWAASMFNEGCSVTIIPELSSCQST